jgi:hypothetical protein
MDTLVYVETLGMNDSEVAEYLQSAPSGVLALADDGRAYAIPVAHAYDEGRLFVRLTDDGRSEKIAFLETTAEATFVCYGESGEDSWSVIVRGPLTEVSADRFDENENPFRTIRLFDEDATELDVRIFEFEDAIVTGRRTPGENPWRVVLPRHGV